MQIRDIVFGLGCVAFFSLTDCVPFSALHTESIQQEIKILTADQWSVYREFRLAALQESPIGLSNPYAVEAAYTQKEWRDTLQSTQFFGFFKEGVLVGVAGITYSKDDQLKHKGHVVGVYVIPACRGAGVAHSLMRAVIDYARGNFLQLTLTVRSVNTHAINFYKKHGFTVYGVEPRGNKIGDTFYDVTSMVLFLDKHTPPVVDDEVSEHEVLLTSTGRSIFLAGEFF